MPAFPAMCFLSRRLPPVPDPPIADKSMKFASVLTVVVQHQLTLTSVVALRPTLLLLLQALQGVRGSTLKVRKPESWSNGLYL